MSLRRPVDPALALWLQLLAFVLMIIGLALALKG
jgi:hypothetical protein